MEQKQKLIVILGATASGKSDLAVALAKKFNCEIISADSRQVYKGLNIGTGKITRREMRGVRHHLLDVANPKNMFTVTKWKEMAERTITDIARRGKFPIVCGGTGLYIQSIVDDIMVPKVPPNMKLRIRLEKKTPAQLFAVLSRLDPARAKTIDQHNPRRLIRAIEIASVLGSVPALSTKPLSKYDILQIGIKTPDEILKKKIRARLLRHLKYGMIAETRRLHTQGLSWRRMDELGLEYRFLARYLRGQISKTELSELLNNAIWHYARRQKTWFKRDSRIQWFSIGEYAKIKKEVRRFLA